MEITIKGEAKEIAALVLAVQEQQGLGADFEEKLAVSTENCRQGLRDKANGK